MAHSEATQGCQMFWKSNDSIAVSALSHLGVLREGSLARVRTESWVQHSLTPAFSISQPEVIPFVGMCGDGNFCSIS